MSNCSVRIAAFLVLVCATLLANSACAEGWRAGAAAAKITPRSPMWMAGYAGRDHPAEGTLADLWAKALVLEDGSGQRAVLITLDLIGIDRGLSQSVCTRIQSRFGVERRQIIVCTSHTHTGPVVARNLRPMHYALLSSEQQQAVDKYSCWLEDRIVETVARAERRLAPANLSWGSGQATFAVNRRNNVEKEVPRLRDEGKLAGPFDHDVPVLAVRDNDNQLRAVVFGYACHATVLSFYQWSGDYPGFAQMELEHRHAECVAMFWAGCGGDQNPLPRRTVELAQEYGTRLADAVDNVLDEKVTPITGNLEASYAEIDLPLAALPSRAEIEKDAQSTNKYIAARAKAHLAQLDAGQPLAQTYPYPVSVWRLGSQVQFVALGGEVVVDYALRIKDTLTGKRTWVAAYANDVMAYIPSRRVLREGGYEGGGAMIYYGLPTVWDPEVEDMIVDKVHRLAIPATTTTP
ncbi:MAG: neutral/alkaline non-lysosomal ceramidase N-terminal domain-containing protein [Planctomycetales bacterium]|nr:neutral/alkaline non-lysosomal ceramidase N-terminal domain-containing protein [Planctomycetales bacterium]